MKNLLLFYIVILSIGASAQSKVFPFSNGKKWGLVNHDLKCVLKPQFDSIAFFTQRGGKQYLAIFHQKGKLGLMDTAGKVVMEAVADKIEEFIGQEATQAAVFSQNGKFGVVNLQGKIIAKPEYGGAAVLWQNDGPPVVKLYQNSKLVAIIDTEGNPLSNDYENENYDVSSKNLIYNLEHFPSKENGVKGILIVNWPEGRNDNRDSVFIPGDFEIKQFYINNGLFLASSSQGKFGLGSFFRGEITTPFEFERILSNEGEWKTSFELHHSNGLMALANHAGKQVCEPVFVWAKKGSGSGNSYYIGKLKNGKVCWFDDKGKMFLPK